MIYIANWKMQKTFNQAIEFVQSNKNRLIQLLKNNDKEIVLAPSFPALHAIAQLLSDSRLKIAAQDCSSHALGAFTGAVDAVSLQQVGCTYCIVGHSERRILFNETSEQIAQKLKQVLQAQLTPIICIGETLEQYKNQQTISVLYAQFLPIFAVLEEYVIQSPVYIAYEPVWSIGTGLVPDKDYLCVVFNQIQQWCKQLNLNCYLIYGGSVNPSNIHELKKIVLIDGFLIGGASLIMESLEKIIT